MPSENLTAVGYLRVSTERQATEEKTSLADQRAAIKQLARRLGAEIVRWFEDPGASGATAENRPAFMAMLSHCETHQQKGLVLVLNDSRFGRFDDPEESAYWRHHLRRLGWVVRFAEGDEDTEARPVVRAIHAMQATAYREGVRRNARRGRRSTVEAGYWSTRAPFGYRRIVAYPPGAARVLEHGQFKASNEKVKLTPHPEEAAVVRWVFERYADGGESLHSLVRILKARVPERRWSRTCVAALLKNEAYRGAIVGSSDGGEYRCEAAHPAIITDELWLSAQRRLDANRALGSGVRNTHYLVSGLLRCIHCGEPYTGGGGGRSRNVNPEREHRRFYRDNGGVAGTCPGRIGTIMRHLVDDRVLEVLGSTLTKPVVRRRIETAIARALEGGPAMVRESEASARATRARLEQRRDRLVGLVANGSLLIDEAAGQLEQTRAALADVEARIQRLQFEKSRTKVAAAERERLLQVAFEFPAARLSGAALRRFVARWLSSLTFDKVSRTLTLGIRCVPAVASLGPSIWPERGEQKEGGLIVRSTSLLQPGHEYRVAEAEQAMRGTA